MDLFHFLKMLMAIQLGNAQLDDDSTDSISYLDTIIEEWKYLTLDNFTVNDNLKMVELWTGTEEEYKRLLDTPMRAPIDLEDTVFTLFTRNTIDAGVRVYTGESSTLRNGNFDPRKSVVIATHGYLSSGTTDWMIQLKNAKLFVQDCNFFTLDWSECADTFNYPRAKKCTEIVGKYVADFLTFLELEGVHDLQVHLMGHSLGAHLMAQVSRYGHKVARISGWDPTGILFSDDDLALRIDPEDAYFVDIIHTSRVLGFELAVGHIDFFPNGGENQPTCHNFVCRHSMSYYYYIQSLYNPEKYPAKKCETIEAAVVGICDGPIAFMGEKSIKGEPGIYYTECKEPATGEPPKRRIYMAHSITNSIENHSKI